MPIRRLFEESPEAFMPDELEVSLRRLKVFSKTSTLATATILSPRCWRDSQSRLQNKASLLLLPNYSIYLKLMIDWTAAALAKRRRIRKPPRFKRDCGSSVCFGARAQLCPGRGHRGLGNASFKSRANAAIFVLQSPGQSIRKSPRYRSSAA
jgi:hypothetical protein